jgi:rhodanese-related sulfurtransferase
MLNSLAVRPQGCRWAVALACALGALLPLTARANEAAALDAMAAYLEFVDYGGGVIFAEQIPKADWARFMVIDARDKAQFDKAHIPGAVNLEWRQVLAQRSRIPKDKPVLIYCNSGSLSAQAGFALRVAGWENLRILQGGFDEWRAKGGFDAAERAAGAVRQH